MQAPTHPEPRRRGAGLESRLGSRLECQLASSRLGPDFSISPPNLISGSSGPSGAAGSLLAAPAAEGGVGGWRPGCAQPGVPPPQLSSLLPWEVPFFLTGWALLGPLKVTCLSGGAVGRISLLSQLPLASFSFSSSSSSFSPPPSFRSPKAPRCI